MVKINSEILLRGVLFAASKMQQPTTGVTTVMSPCPPNDSERAMFALPIRQGGLGIFDPRKSSQDNYQFSTSVTSP